MGFHKICRCFARDLRVVSRHGVLHATANGRGMTFHPFAKFSIRSSHLPLQGSDSPQHLWCVQLTILSRSGVATYPNIHD
eukprot:5371129-Prymnesium_polylepis.1